MKKWICAAYKAIRGLFRRAPAQVFFGWCQCGGLVIGSKNHPCDRCGRVPRRYFNCEIELVRLREQLFNKSVLWHKTKRQLVDRSREIERELLEARSKLVVLARQRDEVACRLKEKTFDYDTRTVVGYESPPTENGGLK
jgi:hypothetical protein